MSDVKHSNPITDKKNAGKMAQYLAAVVKKDGDRLNKATAEKLGNYLIRNYCNPETFDSLEGILRVAVPFYNNVKLYIKCLHITLNQFAMNEHMFKLKQLLLTRSRIIGSFEIENDKKLSLDSPEVKKLFPEIDSVLHEMMETKARKKNELYTGYWRDRLIIIVAREKKWSNPISDEVLISKDFPWQKSLKTLWEKLFVEKVESIVEENQVSEASVWAAFYCIAPLRESIVEAINDNLKIIEFVIPIINNNRMSDMAKIDHVSHYFSSKFTSDLTLMPLERFLYHTFHILQFSFISNKNNEKISKVLKSLNTDEIISTYHRILLIVIGLRSPDLNTTYTIKNLELVDKISGGTISKGNNSIGWSWSMDEILINIKTLKKHSTEEFIQHYMNEQFLSLRDDVITLDSIAAKSNMPRFVRGKLMEIAEKQKETSTSLVSLNERLKVEKDNETSFKIRHKIQSLEKDPLSGKTIAVFSAMTNTGELIQSEEKIKISQSLKMGAEDMLTSCFTSLEHLLTARGHKKGLRYMIFLE